MDRLSSDVLIVGSGAAGLRAAIATGERGRQVLVISKGLPGMGTSTILSQGAFAGAHEGGSPEDHRARTLQAGRGINQLDLVDVLVQEGPLRLRELVEWGARSIIRHGSLYVLGRPAAWGDEIVRCLLDKARGLGVRLMGGLVVRKISIAEGKAAVLAYSRVRDEWLSLTAKAVILATGGAGALFLRHDNPQGMLGEGYTLALDAGALLQDMEFVQFFPLGLAENGLPPILIPPRLADRGRLFNGAGEDILEKYEIQERPAGVRARDRLSQAFFREIHREEGTVWLDLRGIAVEHWQGERRSPRIWKVLGERYGALQRPVSVAPMAHHVMGGVRIDPWGATSVPGIFAAGEVTGGLHGANRMGGNALTETLVFGARAGHAAASWAEGLDDGGWDPLIDDIRQFLPDPQTGTTGIHAATLRKRLRQILWEDGGILRSHQGLVGSLERVEEILDEARQLSFRDKPRRIQEALEIQLGARTAHLIVQAALRREESRGAHLREDFPQQDDERWRGHLQVRLSPEDKLIWTFEPIQADQ